jgi:hypothetical protein
MMSSFAFAMAVPIRESENHFQRFGAMDWETQFALWHSVFMIWWILLIVLIQKSPAANVDYRYGMGCAFTFWTEPRSVWLSVI